MLDSCTKEGRESVKEKEVESGTNRIQFALGEK